MNDVSKTFLVRYRHEGAEWGFDLMARDLDDAKARLSQLALGRIDGELVMRVPAATGPLAALIVGIRNGLWRLAGAR